MAREPIYVLYQGDEVVDIGTARELAERRGVRPDTIRSYATKSYRKMHEADENHVLAVKVD